MRNIIFLGNGITLPLSRYLTYLDANQSMTNLNKIKVDELTGLTGLNKVVLLYSGFLAHKNQNTIIIRLQYALRLFINLNDKHHTTR